MATSKALILFRNHEEKVGLKKGLGDIEALVTQNFKEWLAESQKPIPYDIYVIDEMAADTEECLLAINKTSVKENPIIVILTSGTELNTDAAPLTDRVQRYQELGAELMIHRPFGIKEFTDIMVQANKWVSEPPPWVVLLRSGRKMMAAHRFEDTIYGLGKLYTLMPKNLNVGLSYARALMSGNKPQLDKAIEVLCQIEMNFAESNIAREMLIDCYFKTKKISEAFAVSCRLTRLAPTLDNFNRCLQLAVDLCGVEKRITPLENYLELLQLFDKRKTIDVRKLALTHVFECFSVESGDKVAALLALLAKHTDVKISWAKVLKETLARNKRAFAEQVTEYYTLMEAVLEQNPHDSDLLRDFVDLAIERKHIESLDKLLKRMKSLGSTSRELPLGLAKLAVLQGDPEKADAAWTVAERMGQPQDRWAELTNLRTQIAALRNRKAA